LRIPEILELAGLALEEGVDLAQDASVIPADQFEAMAEAEHGGWEEQKRIDGWTWSPNRLDSVLRHDLLVPYERLTEKIKEYDRIMLFRHIRNDGDCVGATKGFKRILQLSFPEKEIYLIDEDTAKYLEFMGPEDAPVADELYADALGIVIDTATENRISNKKYTLCKELIKIDHHIPLVDFGNLIWVEEERSSACEMIVDFYNTFKSTIINIFQIF
jgi:hypothetical protein